MFQECLLKINKVNKNFFFYNEFVYIKSYSVKVSLLIPSIKIIRLCPKVVFLNESSTQKNRFFAIFF